MRVKNLTDVMPIAKIEQDYIITRQGDIAIGYELLLPEIFTQATADYENMHNAFAKAIRVLPLHTVMHKQDWYVRCRYEPLPMENESFLAQCSEAHFAGRPYLEHRCYLYLVKRANEKRMPTSVSSSLLKGRLVPQQVLDAQQTASFSDKCGQFIKIIEDTGKIEARRLTAAELGSGEQPGIIEQYCYLLHPQETPVVRDVQLTPDLRIGNEHCQLFTLAGVEDLPALCAPRMTFDKLSTEQSKMSVCFTAPLNQLLPYNHIYNQYILITDPDATIKKMEAKRLRLQSLSKASRDNLLARDATNAFLNEAISQQRLTVKAHFNIMAWSDNPEEKKSIRNAITSGMAQLDARPKEESVSAAQLFWAGIPGNAAELPLHETFDTFCEQACCFINFDTGYRTAEPGTGIRFGDRLTGRPLTLDLFNKPMATSAITNRNMFVCGVSGGGKSVTMCHIHRTLYDAGAHAVIVDIGGSYKSLCDLLKGVYFTYTEANPIAFNPFFIPEGQTLDTEKKESLKSLLVAIWKQAHESYSRSEYVALSNAISGYYEWVEGKDVFIGFDSFYDYLSEEYVLLLEKQRVKDKDFDIYNFLYVLRPYYKGGEFSYLLNARENLDLLHERLVIFELDAIKNHQILFPVITMVICELFVSKIRKIKGVFKVLTIEEAWKAIARTGMAEFIQYVYKTIRKHYGIANVVTQEVNDLLSSPIIKETIIANADTKILMDMRKMMNKFDELKTALGMSESAKNILLSVNRDNEPGRFYREIYIDQAGAMMKVVRNELSLQEYLAYTTEEKEKVQVQAYAEQYGSLEAGIQQLALEMKNRHH